MVWYGLFWTIMNYHREGGVMTDMYDWMTGMDDWHG